MRAALFEQFGGPDVLRIEPDQPDPVPAADEVLVAVAIVSVNRTLDLMVRDGRYTKPVTLPHIPGVDPVGRIVAVGADVADRRPGQRIAAVPWRDESGASLSVGIQRPGGCAELVALPARATVVVPDALDDAAANFVVRHVPQAIRLIDEAILSASDTVLVMGAAGGLGSAVVQVARRRGLNVIAAAGSAARVDFAQRLGADYGVNYREEDLTGRVMDITNGVGVQAVIENVGDAELFPKALASMARGGRLVTAGAHADGTVPLDLRRVYLGQLSILGRVGARPGDIDTALKMAVESPFEAMVAATFPLDRIADAHRAAADRTTLGKILIEPAARPAAPEET